MRDFASNVALSHEVEGEEEWRDGSEAAGCTDAEVGSSSKVCQRTASMGKLRAMELRLVLEFCDAGSLRDVLDRVSLSWRCIDK